MQTVVDIPDWRKVQEELRSSRELLKLTLMVAPVGLAYVALDGRWLMLNDRLCEISGYHREELLRMTYCDLTYPDDCVASPECLLRLLCAKRGPYSVETRFVRKDRHRIWVRVSAALVRGPSDEPECLVCTVEDVTERKLKETLRELLTSREMEILGLVSSWLTDQEIARKLGYSKGTIKADVRHILHKLRVKGRRQAVQKAVDIGLITPSR